MEPPRLHRFARAAVSRFVRFVVVSAMAIAMGLIVAKPAFADVLDGLPALKAPMDRTTPRRAFSAYLDATRIADFDRAAHVLDLRSLPPAERAKEGPARARELRTVLDRKLWTDPMDLSDDVDGKRDDNGVPGRLGVISLRNGVEIPVALARVRLRDGSQSWLVTDATVQKIPALDDAFGTGEVEELMPAFARVRYAFDLALWQIVGLVLAIPLSFVLAFVLAYLLRGVATHLAKRTRATWDDEMVVALHGPTRLLLVIGVYHVLALFLRLPSPVDDSVHQVLTIAGVVGLAWGALRVVSTFSNTLEKEAGEAALANGTIGFRARGVRTRVAVLRRVVHALVLVVSIATVLLQFERVRTVGVSLLASAGLAGIVMGLAAQKSIGALLAGLQLSITQPIRIGDSVVIEGEFGTIEEINLTYVVVKIWDERRLIVPMTRFLEQPFQNWTKTSSQLLGTILMRADYTLRMDVLREQLDRVLATSALWDTRVKNIQVTDAAERTVEVRIMVSARNASDLWDLRVYVREHMIAWLRDFEGGAHLPRTRVMGDPPPPSGEPELRARLSSSSRGAAE